MPPSMHTPHTTMLSGLPMVGRAHCRDIVGLREERLVVGFRQERVVKRERELGGQRPEAQAHIARAPGSCPLLAAA